MFFDVSAVSFDWRAEEKEDDEEDTCCLIVSKADDVSKSEPRRREMVACWSVFFLFRDSQFCWWVPSGRLWMSLDAECLSLFRKEGRLSKSGCSLDVTFSLFVIESEGCPLTSFSLPFFSPLWNKEFDLSNLKRWGKSRKQKIKSESQRKRRRERKKREECVWERERKNKHESWERLCLCLHSVLSLFSGVNSEEFSSLRADEESQQVCFPIERRWKKNVPSKLLHSFLSSSSLFSSFC